jgi:peptide/nickel transport system permease protein
VKTGNFELRAGAVLCVLIAGLSAAGVFYQPYGINEVESGRRFLPPQGRHLLGTDNLGRDVFSRIMAGGKYTLLVAVLTVAGSALAGTALGLAAGWAGGLWDELAMRLMDALSSFPGLLLALVMTALFGAGGPALAAALLILFIPGFTRIARNGTLQYKRRDFVRAAEIMGASAGRILWRHILPNLAPPLLSAAALGLSNAILAEAAMSYLGLGIQPPLPSWGRMLAESQNYLFNAPWCALAPGMLILLAALAFHTLGEGLRRRAA